MCGIVGFSGNKNALPVLIEGLERLEYRGYDSAGVALCHNNEIDIIKASGNLENLKSRIKDKYIYSNCGIGHTRWATHGAPTDANAHPHISGNRKFAIVHNGIIENYAKLKQELEQKGYIFKSQTDTEVIAHLLEYYYKGDVQKALSKTILKLKGSYALGILCSDYPDTIYAVKLASPLIVGIGDGENYFASDVTAIISYTKNVVYMHDREIAKITPQKAEFFDFDFTPIKKETSVIEWDAEQTHKDGYEHFMLKEIMEQPSVLKKTIEANINNGRISFKGFDPLKEKLPAIKNIIINACGSAYHAGCVARYVIEQLCGIDVKVELASELRYRNPIISKNTLLISVSQSGETADTIAALKECKKRGAVALSIVNVSGSTVAKLSDYVIYTKAGPEIAVATTKGYTTQVAVLNMFALWIAQNLNLVCQKDYDFLLEDIVLLPDRVQRCLDTALKCETLANKYANNKSVFFIGRNIDYAVSMEGSLKLKEISYIPSQCCAAGELKHGTIALIDKNSLVVALCCVDSLFDKTMSNIKEVKARQAEVVAVAAESNKEVYNECDDVIYVPKAAPFTAAICEIIPLQLFSYYVAKQRGCNIDKPKNLAKSVTVE